MASLARGTLYNMAGSLTPLAIALVTVPAYLKVIGPERYGVLAIFWLLLGYFGLFDLGLSRATAYHMAASDDRDVQRTVFWTSTAINPVFGLVGGAALYWGASTFFDHVFNVSSATLRAEIRHSLFIIALAVPVATLTGTFTGVLNGKAAFGRLNLVTAISSSGFQLFPLLAALTIGVGLDVLLIAAMLPRVLGMILLGYLSWNLTARGTAPRCSWPMFKKLFAFGGWASVTSMLGSLLVLGDRFVIGTFLNATMVGYYTIPFQLTQRVVVVPSAITTALFPKLAAAEPNDRAALAKVGNRAIIGILLPILAVAIACSGIFLRLWVGQSTANLIDSTMKILLIATMINSLALVPCVSLQASGRPDLVARAIMIEIPIFLPLFVLAVKFGGLTGCAIVVAARFYFDLLLQNWFSQRRLPAPAVHLTVAILALGALAPCFGQYHSLISGIMIALALLFGARAAPGGSWNPMTTFRSFGRAVKG